MLNLQIPVNILMLAATYLLPSFLFLLFIVFLIITKLHRKKFTILNVLANILIGIAIVAYALYVAYSGIEDALIGLFTTLLILGFPPFLLLLFASSFIIIKLRKKKFTILNTIISLLIGVGLVVAALYVAYWGIALLQGIAFMEYHGFN